MLTDATEMAVHPFERFVHHLIQDRFHTAQALADAIAMSLSAFARGVRQGTLSEGNLIRLAEVAGIEPGRLLRLADKPEVADCLDRLYGRDRRVLSQLDQQLLALPTPVKQALLRCVETLRHTDES
jgi:hypothetical protein